MSQRPIPDQMKTEILDDLSTEQFASMLATRSDHNVVTLLMPMERKGPATRKNPIVFKNAVTEARRLLPPDDLEHQPIGRLIRELQTLDNPTDPFWQDQLGGLAMVASEDDGVRAYKVPFPLDPFVRVGPRPYLAPLLRLHGARRYPILTLDLNELRLFSATRWKVDPLPLEGIPTSLEQAMRFDDPEKSVQARSVSSGNRPGPGGGNAAFHGHGAAGDENRNKRIDRFFEKINAGLDSNIPAGTRPIVLFGPPEEIGRFRAIRGDQGLHQDAIPENPSGRSRDELEARITSWIAERERLARSRALAELPGRREAGQAAIELPDLVRAATEGRIATLFVRTGARRFGTVDPADGRTTIHPDPRPGDDELIDLVATRSATTGARIHILDPDDPELPDQHPAAAILRY